MSTSSRTAVSRTSDSRCRAWEYVYTFMSYWRRLFRELVGRLYRQGRASEAASFLEIDAVIDPADTRRAVASALASAGEKRRRDGKRFVDTW